MTTEVAARTGVVVVSRHGEVGDVELRRLAPGDFFGESSLFTGSGEARTVRALTFTVIYEVGAALAALMKERPSIADEISVTLSRRATGAFPEPWTSAISPPHPRSPCWFRAFARLIRLAKTLGVSIGPLISMGSADRHPRLLISIW